MFDNIYKKRRVLITGHTGFKGSWLAIWLKELGADVIGYALDPPSDPNNFEATRLRAKITHIHGDIRYLDRLIETFKKYQPEFVFHLAAQPLVLLSYDEPKLTFDTNIGGSVNVFEAVRLTPSVKVLVNITSDKCYENKEWHWGYRENEPMGGYDPYSNSKACSELVTASYRNSFFNPKDYKKHGVAIASARAGNVIGGGDWAEDRLIPDFIRAISNGEEVKIRSPYAIRPWQHVLEPLGGYMMLAEKLYTDGPKYAEAWNFGPDDRDAKNVEWIAEKFCSLWGKDASYAIDKNPQPHEANYLKLDCSKAKTELGWTPKWDIEKALGSIVDWYQAWINKNDTRELSLQQMKAFFDC